MITEKKTPPHLHKAPSSGTRALSHNRATSPLIKITASRIIVQTISHKDIKMHS
jgi:hypothetical protein